MCIRDSVRVAHLFQDLYFTSDAFHVFLVVNLVLFKDFDCNLPFLVTFFTYFLTCQGVLSKLYLTKSSFAEMFACKY